MLRPPMFLLLPALLLAACGQSNVSTTQPVVAAPVNSTPSGVYQISFQNVGSPDFTASAGSASPSGLQSLGLVGTPEAFTFVPIATSTFVVKATGIRHVQATFRVTNNTGLTLNSLKFVPVVPTGGSTVFSGVTYYDGSDASSKAGGLTTVQAQNFVTATGQAVTDAGSSPYVTGLNVSGVDTTGRGISSIKTYGWQAAARLAPGAVAVVTFAVDLPADANPKNDPFNFSLNVTSVQDGTTLTSAVQQYNRTTKSYGNYSQFPTSGNTSLPAYYDLKNVDRDGTSVPAVLCSFDGATVSNISNASFPNRYRVSVTSLGNHTLQVYGGTACPGAAGTPLISQTMVGVLPQRVSLASGDDHSLALKADGTVRSWGDNVLGQLGNGSTTNSSTPVTVSGLTDVVGLAGGGSHSLALKADGTVRSWGYNQYEQLGNGTTTNSSTPVTVSGLADVVGLAGGNRHSLALKADGTVRSWGFNAYGQLGNGSFSASSTPVTVSGLADVVGLAGGNRHSLALKADGTVRSWGDNQFGQLGNRSVAYYSSTPLSVSGLTDAVGISGGNSHSLALKADGTVRSWGSNLYGQLGNGTTTDSSTPVSIALDGVAQPTP